MNSRVLFVVLLSVLGIIFPTVIQAQGCQFVASQPGATLFYGNLKNCGYGSDNSISFSSGGQTLATMQGTHGGYNFAGPGTICVRGTSSSLAGGSQESCFTVGGGQPAPAAPPANNGGQPPQPADIPFVGQSNQPSGNWVQAQANPTYVYEGQGTNTRIVAQMQAGMYLSLNGTSNDWTQVIYNGRIGYVINGNGQTVRNLNSGQGGQSPAVPPANSGGGNNPYASARLGDGGLDVVRICNVSGQKATNNGVNAWSWGCNGNYINKDAACALVWPEKPYARVVGGLDGWSCHPTPQEQEQPTNTVPNYNPPPANNSGGGSNGGTSGGNNGSRGGVSSPATCNMSPRLVVGKEGHVLSNQLNVRSGPGTNNQTVITMQRGDYFSVTGGPTCVQGYNWWNVSFLGRNGYVAEGINGTYYAEPSNPAIPPVQPPQADPPRENSILSRFDSNVQSVLNGLKSVFRIQSSDEIWEALQTSWGIVAPCGLTVSQFLSAVQQAKASSGPSVTEFAFAFSSSIINTVQVPDVAECLANLGDAIAQPFRSLNNK